MSALNDELRSKIKNILTEHGTPFIDELPDDEYDCCVEEMGNVLWEMFQERAVNACNGTYSNGVVNAVFQQRIREIRSPFAD